MRDELEQKLARFTELEQSLLDPAVMANSSKMTSVMREHGSLSKLVTKYRRFKELNQQIAEATEMQNGKDADLRELAEMELPELREKRETIWNELLDMTIGGEDANRTRCVMEIRAGIGGDEAGLFAGDLYDMYRRHIEAKGWKLEILDFQPTELGGFKEMTLAITGEGCYRELQYESGGHRVQRVPETEAKGRIQTSLATVAVMAEPEDVEIDLDPESYVKETMRASGPGGQHVNKTSSAIRLTHKETGITVSMQDEKSQHKNFAKAIRLLKARVYEHFRSIEDAKRADKRKSLVGSGDRSQRIRTYNFQDNRLTDHRIGLTIHKLDQIMAGNFQDVTDALMEYDRQQQRGLLDEVTK